MRFQTNGFKASRLVSQLAIDLKPMVLRRLVQSHEFRLQKNQWLMLCFAVSLLNRFLKPMVLRPLVASHNWHARLKGLCDKNGCDIQLNRLGQTNFFGPGADFHIDSTKPITVITQFITNDGTDFLASSLK